MTLTFWQALDTLIGMDSVSEQVRHAIKTCGLSRYALARETGVAESALSRFMSGERGLSMRALDAVGAALRLRVAATPATAGQRRRKA